MAETRFGCPGGGATRETCCIETGRIFDSCRDRDCFENVRVSLTDCGCDIINRTGNVRAKDASIAWTYIGIDPVRFNRGFYTVNIRFFVKITFEACTGGCKPQEFEGVAVLDKRVVLYGGESNVNVFRSGDDSYNFCRTDEHTEAVRNMPEAVVEVVDPIILGAAVYERTSTNNCCCCCSCEIPAQVAARIDGQLSQRDGENGRYLAVSVGLFSVIRLVRPAQLLVSATEYAVPDKECVMPKEENPCAIFRTMSFPVNEFNPPLTPQTPCDRNRCG